MRIRSRTDAFFNIFLSSQHSPSLGSGLQALALKACTRISSFNVDILCFTQVLNLVTNPRSDKGIQGQSLHKTLSRCINIYMYDTNRPYPCQGYTHYIISYYIHSLVLICIHIYLVPMRITLYKFADLARYHTCMCIRNTIHGALYLARVLVPTFKTISRSPAV